MFTHGRRSRGGGGGGGGGGCSPLSFGQTFAKSLFFASVFGISLPTVPSRSSLPPHFQIHSAVHVTKSSLRNLTNIATCHFLKHFVKHSNICNICESVFSSTSLQDKENTVVKTVKNLTFYGSVLDRMILK